MASAIQNDADNLEAALSLLDEYVTHDRDSIREENSFNDYHEIADLCNEVKCTGIHSSSYSHFSTNDRFLS